MTRRVWLGLVLLVGGWMLNGAGCGAAPPRPEGRVIVTTCGMVTDIVRVVAGEQATVEGIMGEGVDPHLYKATRNDLLKLSSADIVFYCGLTLEGRMGDTFTKMARSGKPIFAVTEGIDPGQLREPPEFHGHWDPHAWMDVKLWSQCVDFVAHELGKFDPDHASYYENNAQQYRQQLVELDEYVRRVIDTIPPKQRVLVTAHDAFGYFAEAYGMEVRSVQGLTTESEAGVDDINRLVQYIVEHQIGAIFVESSVPEKSIRAVIEGAAQQNWQVKVGGTLFSDAMGPAGTYEGTYLGMIDHNATTISRALGGDAPERGMHGKLSQPVP